MASCGLWRLELEGPEGDEQLVLVSQHMLLLCVVLLLALHAANFAHRTLNGSDGRHPDRGACVVCAGVMAVVQAAVATVVLGPSLLLHALYATPWYVFVLGGGVALLAHVVDSVVKRHDRKTFERTNKRMYLEFTTKLGMHSPIEPGHRTPTSYLDDDFKM